MTRLPLIGALFLLGACSDTESAPDLRLSDAWARETVAGQGATAAYLVVANRGGGGDRLLSASVAPPARAALHTTDRSDGIARMRAASGGLEIPAGGSLELGPGGNHIMITGLSAPLRPGDTLQLTLRFEQSGERMVEAKVRDAAGNAEANR